MSSSRTTHPDHRVVFAPKPYAKTGATVFLSGSIDAPPATWQSLLTSSLSHLPITVLNPHRADWDSSWVEDPSNAQFAEQVNWELDGMENADVIAVYFRPNASAPITLMELGLFARKHGEGKGKMVVACPEGYWKRGNVRMVCNRFGIECVETVDELKNGIVSLLREMGKIE